MTRMAVGFVHEEVKRKFTQYFFFCSFCQAKFYTPYNVHSES